MSENSSSSSGNSLFSLLTVAFVVLKLCHVIEWSWCWVLSPLWIPVAAIIVGIVFWAIYEVWKEDKQVKDKEAKRQKVYRDTWRERLEEVERQRKASSK